MTWALAKAAHWTPKLDSICARLQAAGGLTSMRPQDCARMLWGLAILNHAPSALFPPGGGFRQLRGAATLLWEATCHALPPKGSCLQ